MHDQTELHWFKASRSLCSGACVELARAGEMIALRDSKNPSTPPFYFTHDEMDAFLDAARQREFDHLL